MDAGCFFLKNTTMKNILVPIDFSKQSRQAFKVAVDLANRTKGKVHLLHVLYLPTLYDTGIAGEPFAYDAVYLDRMQKDATEALEKMKADCKLSVKIGAEVVFGEVITCINDAIKKNGCDLVVIGSSGISGIPSLIVGSVTEKVVRFSCVPVLAVRRAFEAGNIKNILLPSTLTLNQTAFMEEVKELQNFFNATLHILFINTPSHFIRDAEAKEAFQEFIKHYKITNCKTYFRNYRTEEEGIIDFAFAEKMNLITMGTHARKGLSHLFNGSITENVANEIIALLWTYRLKS